MLVVGLAGLLGALLAVLSIRYKVNQIIRVVRNPDYWKPDRPLPLVVGVPVGFVKAVESKALLATQDFPFITALGRKGGTPAAVAIVNALLKMAGENK